MLVPNVVYLLAAFFFLPFGRALGAGTVAGGAFFLRALGDADAEADVDADTDGVFDAVFVIIIFHSFSARLGLVEYFQNLGGHSV
jgi:hypothetical protein